MILFFADRQLNIIGQASTMLPEGLTVLEDRKTEDIETGVAVFECKVPFDDETLSVVYACTEVGNYILRNHDKENEFYTIIDAEIDTKNREVYIYAEDAGLDLLNEVVGAYAADKAYPLAHYVELFAYDSGFEIGTNEATGLTRKLTWDGEATAAERIASVATQFDGCEVSYSFDIDGLEVTRKYINIHKQRGKDVGATLRLNEDIDRIVTKKSIANLATALQCTGGTPEDENTEDDVEPVPITLDGYKYDDGDFYVDGTVLKSRKALQRWSRYSWTKEPNKTGDGGHIVKQYSYDTLSQKELCSHALTELKKICEMEVNYEVDIAKLPDNVKIGDRINIVDDAGELYVSARVLQLETSVADQEYTATLGEYLIKGSGIHQKVAELAAQFSKTTMSVARALELAHSAKGLAATAQEEVDAAVKSVEEAQKAVEEVAEVVETAKTAAANAQAAADSAQAIVDSVENKVESLETTITQAQQAATNAQVAADVAQDKADKATLAAENAQADANAAKASSESAVATANSATSTAKSAQSIAETARTEARIASSTANAAKVDAVRANADIASLGDRLESVSTTMSAEYARKTDLTEAQASLQTQIEQNAAQIKFTATKAQEIDETANDAQKHLQGALAWSEAAQAEADNASEEAEAAQAAATEAAQAAADAQAEADTAKAAANTARSVADQADADLAAAREDLKTVSSRADATAAEIAAAQQAVTNAKAAADTARANAVAAIEEAAAVQKVADAAQAEAEYALASANIAVSNAELAQSVADEAKGNAESAQSAAAQAVSAAESAQAAAEAAKLDADNAQSAANQAANDADAAQRTANEAGAKAAKAATNLADAQERLAAVLADTDATEEEVEAAQAAVNEAQAAANEAEANAAAAQSAADTALTHAQAAQAGADTAQAEADTAQAAANEAAQAANEARGVVEGLAVRVTNAEAQIIQNAEGISLAATKREVAKTLGGYYTKDETDAKISVKSDEINLSIEHTKQTAENAQDAADDVGSRVTSAESILQMLVDSISTLVRDKNGASLMQQTANGWTFNIGSVQDTLDSTTSKLNGVSDNVDSLNSNMSAVQQAVADLGEIGNYVRITTSGDQPCIELGEGDSAFKLKITNTGIEFMEGSATPAWINNESLHIRKAVIEEELRQGQFVWKARASGNLGLLWEG